MASVRIDDFGGLVLTKDEKKGPFWTALKAQNCDIQSGSIDVAYSVDTGNAANLTGAVGRKTIHNLAGTTFLEWTQDVDIATSPLANNSSNRIYYTGDGVPRVTDASMATAGAAPYPALSYVLGIPVYPQVHTLTDLGVGTGAETRAYTYTFVSPWGEEGPPADPKEVASKLAGATVFVDRIGVTTRRYAGSLPIGVGANLTFVAVPIPGYMRVDFTNAGYNNDLREGDHMLLHQYGATSDRRTQSYLISGVSNVGNGNVLLAANIWDSAVPTVVTFRTLPANTYNILNATIDSPVAGKVKVFVDTIEGLRPGEGVAITGTAGVVGLNATFTVDEVSSGTDNFENPFIVIPLAASGAYAGSGGVATRTAKHNVGETRVTNVTHAAGVATLTVQSTAHVAVGDDVVILGVHGAYQVNGKRRLLSVVPPSTITVALPAMAAYIGGGVVILNSPYPAEEMTVTNVTSAGGPYPAEFARLIAFGKTPIFKAGDLVQGYDIGGAVEANSLMVVSSVGATDMTCKCPQGTTAYTAGGKIVKVPCQSRKRIYRTGTGSTGIAKFQQVAEVPGTQSMYVDVIETAALGDVLPSADWTQPPVNMHSIVGHPHSFLMGAAGNVIHKSEPGQPHAWPLRLQQPLGADIVGQNIYGTTLVAMTNKVPFNVTGVTPGSMTSEQQDVGEPCTSKRSVSSTGLGVSYRGTSGIFLIGYQGSENSTRNYLPPSVFLNAADTITAYWGNRLIWIDNATRSGYIFDPARQEKGLTEFAVDYDIYDLHVSPVDGKLYASYVDAGQAKRAPLFAIVASPAKFTYWTQYIRFDKPVSLAALQVDWAWDLQSATMKDREDAIVRNVRRRRGSSAAFNNSAFNELEFNGDELETIYSPDMAPTVPAERFLRATVIANPGKADILATVFDDFVVNDLPVTMADGIESDVYQVKLVGNGKVTAVTMAETVEELAET